VPDDFSKEVRMRAPISVVIPTLNAQASLPRCLEALMEGLDAELIRDLIITDGGSTDGTGAVAQAWGAQVLVGAPSRGGQLRRGCGVAQGEWLLILHADTVLQDGWTKAVRGHLMSSDKAGWFRLRFDTGEVPSRFVAGWANLRSRAGLPYGDQGLLVSRALYDRVGGYRDQPLMEDVAMARALKGELVSLPVLAVTSAAKYQAKGWLRQGASNLNTLLRYAAGQDVDTLANRYRK
jgi:rSAM/selenodomain-associated transferase 2